MDIERIKHAFLNIRKRFDALEFCLVTEDGFPIASTLNGSDIEERVTAVGAIMCGAGERGIKELNLGNLDTVITTGDAGFFVLRRIRDGIILIAVAPPEISLGMVLLNVKKVVPEILAAIDK